MHHWKVLPRIKTFGELLMSPDGSIIIGNDFVGAVVPVVAPSNTAADCRSCAFIAYCERDLIGTCPVFGSFNGNIVVKHTDRALLSSDRRILVDDTGRVFKLSAYDTSASRCAQCDLSGRASLCRMLPCATGIWKSCDIHDNCLYRCKPGHSPAPNALTHNRLQRVVSPLTAKKETHTMDNQVWRKIMGVGGSYVVVAPDKSLAILQRHTDMRPYVRMQLIEPSNSKADCSSCNWEGLCPSKGKDCPVFGAFTGQVLRRFDSANHHQYSTDGRFLLFKDCSLFVAKAQPSGSCSNCEMAAHDCSKISCPRRVWIKKDVGQLAPDLAMVLDKDLLDIGTSEVNAASFPLPTDLIPLAPVQDAVDLFTNESAKGLSIISRTATGLARRMAWLADAVPMETESHVKYITDVDRFWYDKTSNTLSVTPAFVAQLEKEFSALTVNWAWTPVPLISNAPLRCRYYVIGDSVFDSATSKVSNYASIKNTMVMHLLKLLS